MARSSKTTASKSGGGIKARGRPAKKTSEPRKKKTEASRKTVSKTAATRKRRSAKTTWRLRLATRPASTGSKPTTKTIGMVLVASLAPKAAGGPQEQEGHPVGA